MATIINMPSLSPSMEEGKIESWEKEIGDAIASGDLLANIETDKAIVEYETLEEGIIRHFFVEPGEIITVGLPMMIVADTKEEDISELLEVAKEKAKEETKPTTIKMPERDTQASAVSHHEAPPVPVPPPAPPIEPPPASNGRLKVSPLAKKIAAENKIDLSTIRGSGPNGRIVKIDVEQALKRGAQATVPSPQKGATQAPASSELAIEGEYEEIALTGMRKTIATRLVQATQSIPHIYLTVKVQVDALLDSRKQLNEMAETKISINDMILKACAISLITHPQVNSHFTKSALLQFKDANIGIAVALPEGLITPIIRGVNKKGLGQIAKETKDLASRAREKKLAIEEFTGGTFGTSNLGMFGIEQFTAIINPPQACNLAISQAIPALRMNEDGEVIQTHQMKLTLSCDHRVVDGALGAQFLATLKSILENPFKLML